MSTTILFAILLAAIAAVAFYVRALGTERCPQSLTTALGSTTILLSVIMPVTTNWPSSILYPFCALMLGLGLHFAVFDISTYARELWYRQRTKADFLVQPYDKAPDTILIWPLTNSANVWWGARYPKSKQDRFGYTWPMENFAELREKIEASNFTISSADSPLLQAELEEEEKPNVSAELETPTVVKPPTAPIQPTQQPAKSNTTTTADASNNSKNEQEEEEVSDKEKEGAA